MNPDLDVDTGQLRRAASAVAGAASRVREAAGAAPPPVPGPPWATTGATASAADAAGQRLRELGAELSGAAQRIETTRAAYAEADARAAARLRAAR
ncbi:hypothetical protein [Actinoplanes teichomyceticus]|uniref:Excreted virulence factor EspC (Type VII ESX diderm) n=1 Tax=Actinoplanes teichomyceticus TaxID=1867 RepID=A0A561VQF9_ACTTI|nr:hypothetical protein [Actinoplanes teichomyceticus]TWG13849.1 hypothetical protein FHX34_104137 [Actinoplanes teichomyceticus]GIF12326.1 hypothetical protein Ate01nite_23580 [Actinoplanes teichomyceticus]